MFDPAQLAALAAVHRRGSFDLAAADLHVTPSAISQRISALEQDFGTPLLVRSRPLKPTAAGRLLIRHALHMRLLRAELDTLRDTVQELSLNASRVSALLGDSRNAEVKRQTLLTTGLTAFQAVLTFLLAFAMARQFLKREKAKSLAMAAQAIAAGGTPEQQAEWLPNGRTTLWFDASTGRLLAARSIADLVEWSGGLYNPPAKFRSW